MSITAEQVLELRTLTDRSFSDCKRALILAEGNVPSAMELLRAGNLDKAEKQRETDKITKLEARVAYLEKLLGIH